MLGFAHRSTFWICCLGAQMNTSFPRRETIGASRTRVDWVTQRTSRSTGRHRLAALTAVMLAGVIPATACGTEPVAAVSPSLPSSSATPTPSPTQTAPLSPACTAESAKESYPPKVFICTRSDAGNLLWMEQSESRRITDARAAAAAIAAKAAAEKVAAAKAAAEKAAAEQAAQEAAAKEAEAAAAKAAQEQAIAEDARQKAADAAAKAPVPVLPAVPAAPAGCDPNYAGACVPIASDVDCAGGKGNGPAYVRGPVTVIGSDIYGLDSDHDGVGCER